MRLALVQTNPTIGDIRRNADDIIARVALARGQRADLVCFPELALCGYPPKDLLLQEGFIEACTTEAKRIARASAGITVVFGCPTPLATPVRAGGPIANSLLACRDGRFIAHYDKRLLPTYDVFDENRYFRPGNKPVVITIRGAADRKATRVGLSICEDLWKGQDAGFAQRYIDSPDPVTDLARKGVDIIVNPSASPFVLGKGARHRAILTSHAKRHRLFVAAVNQVGGNDDLIFDGHATVIGPKGQLLAAAPGFVEHMLLFDFPAPGPASKASAGSARRTPKVADPLLDADPLQHLFDALVLGVRDYCRKTGFRAALLGLSGGIDSALTAVIGAAALGKDNILGVAMPGPYSSEGSVSDAYLLARNLGIPCRTISIAAPMDGFRATIDADFAKAGLSALGEKLPDLTEENLQSRLRGTTLMALSNRTGAIVLTTGNKSELAVGYCTLYGDMNGGLAVLSDVTKEQVYALSRFINENHTSLGFGVPPIPEASITKPPSAELRPNQTDQDSLPPYPVLDEIIERYVEKRQSVRTILRQTRGKTGFDAATITRVARLIDISEYKRKQAAIGLKVTTVAFGSGRRVPIAQRWTSPA
jgi:NAD+ synthase (glutamine-hydrolysing)